jgi:hypothetical protein
MTNQHLLAAFSVAGYFVALASPAQACGCGGSFPLSLDVRRSMSIFVGTVETVTGGMPQPIVATFAVSTTYRGDRAQPAVVSGNGTDCDINFAKGVTYLVYAQEYAGALWTHKCTRTRPLSDAGEDVRYLENLEAGRPQALVYGDVFRGITRTDGSKVRQALFERLTVVAMNASGRRSVITDQWGPYQIVLAPGDYDLWVERRGKRVTSAEKLSVRAGDERRLSFTAKYD